MSMANILWKLRCKMKKKIILGTILLSVLCFLGEQYGSKSDINVERESYGEGKRTEVYELEIPDMDVKESIQVEVGEREYTRDEIQQIFREINNELDQLILANNENMNHVESNLNLVTEIEGYPVTIRWESSAYQVLNQAGEIQEEGVSEEGTAVELRGIISYGEEQSIYVRNLMIYPVNRTGVEKLLYEIQEEIRKREKDTKEEESFSLPEEVDGKTLRWRKPKEGKAFYVIVLGSVLVVFLDYHEKEKERKKQEIRKQLLAREYPNMISKLAMLLGTGATLKGSWKKIVDNYEEQKMWLGDHPLYEEMKITLYEMQGGMAETEGYERFGRRCGGNTYIKFGAMLSQNLRKGSQGISELLRAEAMQSFEERKNVAKRIGEEASTKLLVPMMGMLVIVFGMVMVPAFLSMQL